MTPKEILSSGGGTQSACIIALVIQGRLPRPDFIAIVDTEREHRAVWEYHEEVIVPELAKVGLVIHRIKKSDYSSDDIWAKSEDGGCLLPVFVAGGGKSNTFCSDKWKVRVRQRFFRARGIPTKYQRAWIGFSLDEANRYHRMKKGEDYLSGLIRFPLIDDVPLNRRAAIKVVEDMGWPTPPRSACWMCPNHTENEWRNLKLHYPDEFQKAVELEREVRIKEPNSFFHVSCLPLDEVDFGNEGDLFRPCDSGMCFV